MKVEYFKKYSNNLSRDMEFKIFGDKGKPLMFFPVAGSRFYEYEDRGIISDISNYIELGKIMVILVDSIDYDTWLSEYKSAVEKAITYNEYGNVPS